jgi:sulfite reductase (NADPH) flavoprotein alpha-component
VSDVELSLEGAGIAYEPGDSLGFMPANDPALVDAVLEAAGLAGNASLRAKLLDQFDITTLTAPGEHPAGWQVIDALEAERQPLTEAQLLARLRPIAPRYYSIASSRKAVGDEAHLLVAAVRYAAHGRARNGVASVDVAERRKAGDRLHVFLKPNAHFRLPADPDRPIIMIGPGTGVAPFRAFMQERDAIGAKGRNWLVFGHRNYTHDFLYQLEWQDLLKRGVLTRLDVAFSRDQPEKRYVQHALWDARHELAGWVQDGAAIYVCGDANAMAKDVHATLEQVLGAEKLDALRREKRYLRDVY